MGTGFWLIQAVFLTAAVATAVTAEMERLRDDRSSADFRQIPIEGSNEFTILEQARLLLLRGSVREARMSRTRLYDDLAPEVQESPRQPRKGAWVLAAGVILFVVGVGGLWRTNIAMDSLEQAQAPFTTAPRMSFIARVVPGPIANPARYLGAVNSGNATGTSLEAAVMLDQKRAFDRWEAVLGIGLALVVTSFASLSSLARDLVGFIGLAALVCGSLSFFELP